MQHTLCFLQAEALVRLQLPPESTGTVSLCHCALLLPLLLAPASPSGRLRQESP